MPRTHNGESTTGDKKSQREQRVGSFLSEYGITEDELEVAADQASIAGELLPGWQTRIGSVLIAEGRLPPSQVASALSLLHRVPATTIDDHNDSQRHPSFQFSLLLEAQFDECLRRGVLPLRIEKDRLIVAMTDPPVASTDGQAAVIRAILPKLGDHVRPSPRICPQFLLADHIWQMRRLRTLCRAGTARAKAAPRRVSWAEWAEDGAWAFEVGETAINAAVYEIESGCIRLGQHRFVCRMLDLLIAASSEPAVLGQVLRGLQRACIRTYPPIVPLQVVVKWAAGMAGRRGNIPGGWIPEHRFVHEFRDFAAATRSRLLRAPEHLGQVVEHIFRRGGPMTVYAYGYSGLAMDILFRLHSAPGFEGIRIRRIQNVHAGIRELQRFETWRLTQRARRIGIDYKEVALADVKNAHGTPAGLFIGVGATSPAGAFCERGSNAAINVMERVFGLRRIGDSKGVPVFVVAGRYRYMRELHAEDVLQDTYPYHEFVAGPRATYFVAE